jgi:hypothetical protein
MDFRGISLPVGPCGGGLQSSAFYWDYHDLNDSSALSPALRWPLAARVDRGDSQSDRISRIKSMTYREFALQLVFHVIYSDRERVIHEALSEQGFSSAEERRNTVVMGSRGFVHGRLWIRIHNSVSGIP